jgi:spore maturation protein CgeB
MTADPLNVVILGLSITSSWGNGHATTYRSLVRELVARGHRVLFLERDKPWYAAARDLPDPPHGETVLYRTLKELKNKFTSAVRRADLVIVGSYVPNGIQVGEWVTHTATGVTAFYDIDTPVTLTMLREGKNPYISPALVRLYHLYLSFTGGPLLERLKRRYGAAMVRPLYCSVDPKRYFPETRKARWDLGYMGTYSSDRQSALDCLLIEPARRAPKTKMVVAGPQYPPTIRWPRNVRTIEHLPPAAHRKFYNEQRFTLNLTRAAMVRAGYSPSVRLFEAAACACPIISDYWEGLDEFFNVGKEILVARTPDEVLSYLMDVSGRERKAMGERARARILAKHTAAHRAAELESYVIDLLNGKAGRTQSLDSITRRSERAAPGA